MADGSLWLIGIIADWHDIGGGGTMADWNDSCMAGLLICI